MVLHPGAHKRWHGIRVHDNPELVGTAAGAIGPHSPHATPVTPSTLPGATAHTHHCQSFTH